MHGMQQGHTQTWCIHALGARRPDSTHAIDEAVRSAMTQPAEAGVTRSPFPASQLGLSRYRSRTAPDPVAAVPRRSVDPSTSSRRLALRHAASRRLAEALADTHRDGRGTQNSASWTR